MADPLPQELHDRISALETGREAGEDFDARSWVWLIALGVLMPAVLLLVGWLAA